MIGFHFKLTYLGETKVAVGMFIVRGGSSVKTSKISEYGPNPRVFLAIALNLTKLLGGNTENPSGGVTENVVISPFSSSLVSTVHSPLLRGSHSS